jgi:hypothetical protein
VERVGDEPALGVVERDAGLVARRLDAEHAHGAATIDVLARGSPSLLYLTIA